MVVVFAWKRVWLRLTAPGGDYGKEEYPTKFVFRVETFSRALSIAAPDLHTMVMFVACLVHLRNDIHDDALFDMKTDSLSSRRTSFKEQ